MARKPPDVLEIVLAGEDGLGRIVVSTESFFEFSFWVSEELEDLVQSRHKRASHSRESSRGTHQNKWSKP